LCQQEVERSPVVNIEALREAVRMQEIDTVVVAMTDMQGRLQGKRFHARFFLGPRRRGRA
jgi:glutamine synthetase